MVEGSKVDAQGRTAEFGVAYSHLVDVADATRHSMIHALAQGETRSASELGRHFRSAQPTISKHLKVLERAGIVERQVQGRVHQFRLRRKALVQAGRWIARHQAFWEGAVDQLGRLLAEGEER